MSEKEKVKTKDDKQVKVVKEEKATYSKVKGTKPFTIIVGPDGFIYRKQ